MASKHEIICAAVIADWTKDHRGRLYFMRQGKARALNSEAVIDFGPLKGMKGFPDLFGWEYDDSHRPIFTVIEVKTKAYNTLTDEQKNFLSYVVLMKGNAYVAREVEDGYLLDFWKY